MSPKIHYSGHTANPVPRYPWSNGKVKNLMKFERTFIDSEDDGKLNWDVNNAVTYSVVNKDALNKYGEYRGWKIMPGKRCPSTATFFVFDFISLIVPRYQQ
jgi:Cu2+-containing amine oxidase